MRKALTFCLTAFLAVLFFAPTAGAQVLKIGVFDIQKIMRESKKIQGYRQELLASVEVKRKPLREKEEGAKAVEEKLRREGQRLSADERKSLEDKLTIEVKDLRRMREDFEQEIQKMDRELTQRAFRDIEAIIRQIGEKEQFTVIFERTSAGIIYFKDTVDITNKVVAQM